MELNWYNKDFENFDHIFQVIKDNFSNHEVFTLYSHVLFTYIAIHDQDIFLDFIQKFIRPKRKLFIKFYKKIIDRKTSWFRLIIT